MVSRRTFKLMPLVKRGELDILENGYGSNESQRFRYILNAPASRESSERFELDVSAIDSKPPKAPVVRSRMEGKQFDITHVEGGEVSFDEESLKEGKATLDEWIQTSTEPAAEEIQEAVPEVVKIAPEPVEVTRWPQDIGVPPPGLARGLSLKVSEEKPPMQNSKKSGLAPKA